MRALQGSRAAAVWFGAWQWLFGVAIAVGLVTALLGFVTQMKFVGAVTLVCGLLGMIACRLGLDTVRTHGRAGAAAPAPHAVSQVPVLHADRGVHRPLAARLLYPPEADVARTP
jgi:hypothetical protein